MKNDVFVSVLFEYSYMRGCVYECMFMRVHISVHLKYVILSRSVKCVCLLC